MRSFFPAGRLARHDYYRREDAWFRFYINLVDFPTLRYVIHIAAVNTEMEKSFHVPGVGSL